VWRIAGRGAIFPFGPALAFSLFINILFPDMLQWIRI
jgi:prepilin signal peptidase PulO-like enzyme (type II secretory pathway)